MSMTASPIWGTIPALRETDPVLMTTPGMGQEHWLKVRGNDVHAWQNWNWDHRDTAEAAWDDGEPRYLGEAPSWIDAMAIIPPIPGLNIAFHWRC